MSALADDRVLDYALHVLHGTARSVDLTERIVEAWERGARGASLRDLEVSPGRAIERAPAVRATATWRWRVAAAAALLVAGGGIAVWIASVASTPAVVARAQSPALVLRAGVPGTLSTDELRTGDVIATPSDASSTLTFADGRRITTGAGAIVALHEREHAVEVELLRGGGSIEAAGGGSIGLDLGFVHAVAPTGAAVAFELPIASSDPLDAALIERLRQRRDRHDVVLFEVASGELWLEHRGGRERLVAGAKRELWNAVPEGDADVNGEKNVRVWVDVMLRRGRQPGFENVSWNEMFAYLATHPARWATILDAASTRLDGAPKPAIAQPLLHFGLEDPTGEGLAFVRALWLRHPECFSDLEIAALAERGVFEFEREASAMLADDDRSRPETMVAALFARGGDERATQVLQRDLDELRGMRELRNGDLLRIVYAGYVLAERGDAAAWRRAIDTLRPVFEDDWRQRRFVEVAACVQLLRKLDEALTAGRPMPFEALLSKEMREAYATALDAPEALRKELDELARHR